MSRHTTRHRMDGELHGHPVRFELLGQLPQLVLGLGDRHAVAGDNDHLVRVRHHDGGIGGFDGLQTAFDTFRRRRRWLGAKTAEQHIGEGAVHGLCHELSKQCAGCATVPAMIMAALLRTKPSKPTASPVRAL